MEKKIIKYGNSLGVSIPAVYLDELGVKYQDKVEVTYDSELKAITIKNKSTIPNDDQLESIVKDIVDKYLKEQDS